MAVTTLCIDDRQVSARSDQTVLDTALEHGIAIPTLCRLEGLSDSAACRLCLVEVETPSGGVKLLASCVTKVAEEMVVRTSTPRLREYRKMIIELLFAERNHVCSVCVANHNCELQALATDLGVDHIRYDYLEPACTVDTSHARYGLDHNRCVLCTRCVRVCDEIEGAHTWDVAGRGTLARIIADMNQPWGTADTCTSCGKCVMACPTGALFHKGASVGESVHDRSKLGFLIQAREEHRWIV
ncbi:MAG: bidirectional hydrogenase complex protein HoxU [Isosphaeraceae bacterium]|nr:bidirectional hydrogenase complex protein HoxU [Isosphaeraceae bacterium]